MTFNLYFQKHMLAVSKANLQTFDEAQLIVIESFKCRKPIFLIGNGGSSATASHFAVDWQKNAQHTFGFYPSVFCLSDNTPLVTAIANDISYEQVFSHQLLNLPCEGGVLVAITGSGKSKNILEALRISRVKGIFSIALTGFDGGLAGQLADLHCNFPSDDIKVVEDLHLAFGHSIVDKLKTL